MRKRITDRSEIVRNAASSGMRRQISDDFQYNKSKLKHLKNVLHKVTVSLGTLVSAYNEFSKAKGPEISPDGLLGGLGYIIPIKDIKETFNTSIRNLSDVADCIADELTNPKWEAESDKDVQKLIKEKKEVEEQVEEDIPEVEKTKEIAPADVLTCLDYDHNIDIEKKEALEKAVRASLTVYSKRG